MSRYFICFYLVSLFSHAETLIKRLDPSVVLLESKYGPVKVSDLQGVDPVLERFEDNLFDFYQKNAEQKLIEKQLEKKAKAKGFTTIDAYLKDFDSKVKVTSQEIKTYKKDKSSQLQIFDPVKQVQREMSDSEISEKLLSEKRVGERKKLFLAMLSDSYIKVLLKRDPIIVPVSKFNPIKGPESAPVTLHAFSDFQCPHCAKSAKELSALIDKHKKKLKVVFHHLPLPFHAQAKPAAIASHCAQEQGKFWQFHDALFELSHSLNQDVYSELAKKLKLNEEKFVSCLKSPVSAGIVDESLSVAQKLGVQSTPSFIVGSKRIAGYKTLAELEKLSDLK